MLSHLVRPLVRSQIQMLAQTQSASGKLQGMIAQWLGYLGVRAEVKQLHTTGSQIQVSLLVSRPEQCGETEWRQILHNIRHSHGQSTQQAELTYQRMSEVQQRQTHRLLAHILRLGSGENALENWDTVRTELAAMGFDEAMLHGIRAALKVPTDFEALLRDLDAEVAAFVLSRAINIALLDRQISTEEDDALNALYGLLKNSGSA